MESNSRVMCNKSYYVMITFLLTHPVVRCPSIKAPAYGDVIPDACKSLLGAQYGDSCFFVCNPSNGYQLEGPKNVLCQHNGSWSTNTEMSFCKGK